MYRDRLARVAGAAPDPSEIALNHQFEARVNDGELRCVKCSAHRRTLYIRCDNMSDNDHNALVCRSCAKAELRMLARTLAPAG
jgi:hypothetical protein